MREAGCNLSEQTLLILPGALPVCINKLDIDEIKTIIQPSKKRTLRQAEETLLLHDRTMVRYIKLHLKKDTDIFPANNYQGGSIKSAEGQIIKMKKIPYTYLAGSAVEICNHIRQKFRNHIHRQLKNSIPDTVPMDDKFDL